jgi:hypothetical protein
MAIGLERVTETPQLMCSSATTTSMMAVTKLNRAQIWQLSHGDSYSGLLLYGFVQSSRRALTFRRNILPQYSG